MSFRVIAISGKFGSGKDTFADFLIDELISRGWSVRRAAFADLLKDVTASIQKTLQKPVEKNRALLQKTGDLLNEIYGEGVFVDPVLSSIEDFRGQRRCFVITDLRRPCEYDALKKTEAVLVRVNGYQRVEGTEEQKNHPTETALDFHEFDYKIINDGSLEDLRRVAADLLSKLEM